MNDQTIPALDLQPGELYLARGPAVLRTILGSCVGVTFWCRRLDAGALCHGVLPLCPAGTGCDPADGGRYVDFSIRHLLREFQALGARREELEIKLFGGADVLPASVSRNRPTVGAMNSAAACRVLGEEGLAVAASDLGGARGRRIQFHTATGEVLLYRLPAWHASLPRQNSRVLEHNL